MATSPGVSPARARSEKNSVGDYAVGWHPAAFKAFMSAAALAKHAPTIASGTPMASMTALRSDLAKFARSFNTMIVAT